MNEHALAVLEFDKVRRMLLRWAFSSLGRERIQALHPNLDLEDILLSQRRASEWKGLELQGGAPQAMEIGDLRAHLARLPRGGAPFTPGEFAELLPLLRLCDRLYRLRRSLRDREPACPALLETLEPLTDVSDLARRLDASFSPSGELLDTASRELARVRRELHQALRSASDLLGGMLDRLPAERREEAFVTLRDGRYVVSVRSSDRDLFPGFLHGRSQTGHSLLLEPVEALDANNRVAELREEEKAEEYRILVELTESLRERAPALQAGHEIVAELDLVRAHAKLSIELRAEPPALRTDASIRIAQGRHPILAAAEREGGGRVVPLDLQIDPDLPVLVISGPNMGGKTVALKTVGLLAAMAQAGLHVPAAPGTELPLVDEIFVDLGDEQSIEHDLSTFAAHLKNIGAVWERATARSLVLFDELGGGTDPEEGAALAMALLDGIAERGSLTVATTHLTSLKLFVQDRKGMENASMEFDAVTMEPRFRLVRGQPGRSRAFEIARRILPGSTLLERAEPFRSPQLIQFDALFAQIDAERRELAAARRRLEEETEELAAATHRRERQAETLRDRIRTLREARQDAVRSAYAQAQHEIESIRREVETELQRAKEAPLAGAAEVTWGERSLAAARQAEREVRRRAGQIGQHATRRTGARLSADRLRPGERAWLPEVGAVVQIDRVRSGGQKVRVEWHGRYLEVGARALEEVPPDASAPLRPASVRVEVPADDLPVQRDLDIRGCRAEDALLHLERFLDQAALRNIDTVRIVHGKGTGVLKREVHRALERSPLVTAFRPAEPRDGGWGVTIAEIGRSGA